MKLSLVLLIVIAFSSLVIATEITDEFITIDGEINSTEFYESGVRVCLANGTNCISSYGNPFDQVLNTTSDVQFNKIAIGTALDPAYSIKSNSSIRSGGSVWSDQTLRTNAIQTQSSGTDLKFYTITTGIIKFMLSGIEQVTIDTNGNITSNGNVSSNYFIGDGSYLTGILHSIPKTTSGNNLYNDSTTIYFNETFNNNTIQIQINNSDLNISHLTPTGTKGDIIYGTTTGWSVLAPAGLGNFILQSVNDVLSWKSDIVTPILTFSDWTPDNGDTLNADGEGDTMYATSPDGSINLTGVKSGATDTLEFQLNETIDGIHFFETNLTASRLYGQEITPLAAGGVSCTTVCDSVDGALYGNEDWTCQGALTVSGTPTLTNCASWSQNRNCFCTNS
jgi:hypothetical protein